MYGGVFQKLHKVWCFNRLTVGADKRLQLFSVKRDVKRFAEMWKQCHPSHLLSLHEYATSQNYLYLVNFLAGLFSIWGDGDGPSSADE